MTTFTSYKRLILIIDDNAANLNVATEYLEGYGFEIIIARNGESGIERAKLTQPALILLDVQMPGIDGFEVCRRLKANPETNAIPIIFMTAAAQTADKVQGLSLGAVDYITKPIELAEMIARVQTHIALHDLQERLEERVQERTAALEAEMAQRQKQEAETERLLGLVTQQSNQLRQLTQIFLQNQNQHQTEVNNSHDQITQDLELLEMHLKQAQQLLLGSVSSELVPELVLSQIDNALDIVAHAQQQSRQVKDNLEQATTAQQSLITNPLLNLSNREYEIFHLLVQGKSISEISDKLFLAKSTVGTYRRRVMDKLEAADLSDLIKLAVQYNVLS